MVMGRPPDLYSDQDCIDLGEEMIAWLMKRKEENKPVFTLSEWYVMVKDIDRSDWWNLRVRPNFSKYYNQAMEIMLYFTLTNAKLETAYGSRFLGIYSKDLREHEREKVTEKADADMAAKEKYEEKKSRSNNDCKLDDLIKAVKDLK